MKQQFSFNFFFSITLLCFLLPACAAKKQTKFVSDHYDLERPQILLLNDVLLEVSGIVFYPKDSTVFAISDEKGYLFKIYVKAKPVIRSWKFSKSRDYEGLALADSTFYVLESDGDVYALNFSSRGDTIYQRKYNFPYNKGNDFETIYFDPELKKLVILCKKCVNDDKHSTTAFSLDPATGVYTPAAFIISNDSIANKIGISELKFRPSDAAIHPLTNDLWILSSVNKMIVVADRKGEVKKVIALNSKFRQPEGIAFTPWGDMIISNEAGDKYGIANLYFFKYKN